MWGCYVRSIRTAHSKIRTSLQWAKADNFLTFAKCATSSLCVWRTSLVCRASTPTICARTVMLPLSTLLFGQPLSRREGGCDVEQLGSSLDRVLYGVMDLLGRETGETEAFAQARMEWGHMLTSDYNFAGIAARRAALLFALHTLEPVRVYFAKKDPDLVADLHRRVLPATIPPFICGMAQRPEGLVVMCSTLTSMWKEDMGSGSGNCGAGRAPEGSH